MKKQITRRGYRTLAIVWTLAASSMAVAFVRRLPEFNLFLLAMLGLSLLAAASFWRACRRIEERPPLDPFEYPPRFSGDPTPFDGGAPNNDSEEKDHE